MQYRGFMSIVCTGSIAYDYLMSFPGHFRDHILPDRLDTISLSFLVDTMVRQRGGTAPNIAYTLALLGDKPLLVGTVGEDFEDYRAWLECQGRGYPLRQGHPGQIHRLLLRQHRPGQQPDCQLLHRRHGKRQRDLDLTSCCRRIQAWWSSPPMTQRP